MIEMNRKRVLIAAALILTLLHLVLLWWVCSLFLSPFEIEEPTYIYIRPQDTEDSVKQMLRTDAHASNLRGWSVARMVTNYTPRTGRYEILPGESMWNVYRKLRRGRQTPVRLVLPSLRSMDRLASLIGTTLMPDSAEVAASLQDSLFTSRYGYTPATIPALFIPNTYEFYWDVTLDQLAERMVKENKRFWEAEDRNAKAQRMGMSHEEVVTLASIVDEETANNGEKPMIAGMYLNRLRIGMLLQADPTVKFAVGDPTLRRIRGSHLKVESPYNTYLNKGLPPGPIRIASVAGIDAVLNHANHDYIYMCAKEDFSGTHNFAATYVEHQKNAARYVKALNERGIK